MSSSAGAPDRNDDAAATPSLLDDVTVIRQSLNRASSLAVTGTTTYRAYRDAGRSLNRIEQLLAAVERHEEAQTWATWDSVVIAANAVRGDALAQDVLTEPLWQVDEKGRLPA